VVTTSLQPDAPLAFMWGDAVKPLWNEKGGMPMPRRTACSVQALDALAELRCRLHEHFMRDGGLCSREHALIDQLDVAQYYAQRADYGRRLLIAVLDHDELEPTRRQNDEWSQLEQLRSRVFAHADLTVAAV
jgi:hypothetical protein